MKGMMITIYFVKNNTRYSSVKTFCGYLVRTILLFDTYIFFIIHILIQDLNNLSSEFPM